MPFVNPAYTRENVLVGQARMFLQILTPTSVPALPADTVALDGAWPSAGVNIWVPVGATEEGLNFRFGRDTEDIMIEEQLIPVHIVPTGIDLAAEVVLSEDTIQTMTWAYGGGTSVVTAPDVGQPGKTTLTLSSDLSHFAFGFEGVNSEGLPRRVLVPDVVSVGQVETAYRRAANARRYATSFRAVCAPEEVEIVEITAAALP